MVTPAPLGNAVVDVGSLFPLKQIENDVTALVILLACTSLSLSDI